MVARSDDLLNMQNGCTLRCKPQVHGAARYVISYTRWVLSIELNSATDNPPFFFDDKTGGVTVLSGGHFHGKPIAIAMDYLVPAPTELVNISEQRLTHLTKECSNQEALPTFLVQDSTCATAYQT